MEGSKRQVAYAEGGAPSKKFKLDNFTLVILIPSEHTATIIGKGGAGIKKIEASSGCRVSCAQSNDLLLGESLRKVTITGGALESVSVAQREILVVMADVEQTKTGQPSEKYTLRLLVPNPAVASLIGKKGSGIRNVTDATGSYVSFCKEAEMPPGYPDRMITLVGTCEQVTNAQQLLTDNLSRMLADGMLDSRLKSPSPQSYSAPQSHVSRFQDTSAMMPLSSMLPQQSVLPSSLASQSTFGSSTYAVDFPATPSFYASPQPQLGKEIESKMYIPNSCVGMVIGARGSAINDVLLQCDNKVYISVGKEDDNTRIEFIGQDQLRPVTIRGAADMVFKAQYLIQSKLQENSRAEVNWIVAATTK